MIAVKATFTPRRAAGAILAAATFLLASPAARAGTANAGIPAAPASDPLAGLPWGNYTGLDGNIGGADEIFGSGAYQSSTGNERRLLDKVAKQPRLRWFGPWDPDDQARQTAEQYIANVTQGNPNVLAQLSVFRLDPWEGDACNRLPSAAQEASYRAWIDAFARGIGGSRVALVLQPDLPFELCVPGHSQLPMHLVAYAARVFDALPHTTVYIDVGASDWPTVSQAVGMLRAAGVGDARGFALGATHYATTSDEIRFGAKLSQALARAGLPGKHFVINTAQNGQGFTYQQYHQPSTFDNATVCATRRSRHCVTLGIPPTWQVSDPRWRLAAGDRALAARYADAYLWIGRPWLKNQNDPFELQRALQLARTSPF